MSKKQRYSAIAPQKCLIAGFSISAAVALTLSPLMAKVYAAGNLYEWKKQTDLNLYGGQYAASASSASGGHLVVAINDGGSDPHGDPLWISSDYGNTWIDKSNIADPNINNYWQSVSMSDNGQKIVAVSTSGDDMSNGDSATTGKVLYSSDGGSTWHNITPNSGLQWQEVGISGDGSKIVAVNNDDLSDIFISDNAGVSWTTSTVEQKISWQSVSLSDNGSKILVGGENNDFTSALDMSDNGGDSWQNVSPDTRGNPNQITKTAISADGSKMYTAVNGWDGSGFYGSVFVTSDEGTNWDDITPDNTNTHAWNSIAVSGSDNALAVQGTDNDTYISYNHGTDWTAEDPTNNNGDGNTWDSIVFNNNGSRIITTSTSNVYSGFNSSLDSPSTTFSNAENGGGITVTTPSGTIITCHSAVKESTLSAQDGSYSYPLGLVDFCFSNAEASNNIVLTFVTNLKPSQVVVRKYNPNSKTYQTVSGATVTATTVNGSAALQVSYSIEDNGPLDTDSAVGQISDPVGLAMSSVTVPNTGAGNVGGLSNDSVIFVLTGISLLSGTYISQKRRKAATTK